MLRLLHIENIAVIAQAEIALESGITVLTGETGAGKSIIIDAVGAILGQRTSRDLIRTGAKKGFISAIFTDLPQKLIEKLQSYGLQDEETEELHIQRQLSVDGKGVCRINMKPVSVSVLREIAGYLINIHGQHDGQKLMDEQYHIEFLDHFAGIASLLKQYTPLYEALIQMKRRIQELERSEQERLQRIDMLSFHLDEITQANLSVGEEEVLAERKAFFDSAGILMHAFHESYQALDMEEHGMCTVITQICDKLSHIAEVSSELQQLAEKAEEIKYLLLDLRDAIIKQQEKVDFSHQEQQAVEERLDCIYHLEQKYGSSIGEVLSYQERIAEELQTLQNADQTKDTLRAQYKETLEQAKLLAQKISEKRREAAKQLEACIVKELAELDMAKVRLEVRVETGNKLLNNGLDQVSFLIAVNPGEELKLLSKVASGGELSRVMLAMKNVLTTEEPVGTLIFDEIDTGVSGRAAQKIAYKLQQIGKKKQTLCVTHLPQIAARGDHHLLIAKSVDADRTYTTVSAISKEERIEEIARMLAGDEITENTRKNADELLKQARIEK